MKVVVTSSIGDHDDCLTKLFGGHKPCYDSQWSLTGHYIKHWIYMLKEISFDIKW